MRMRTPTVEPGKERVLESSEAPTGEVGNRTTYLPGAPERDPMRFARRRRVLELLLAAGFPVLLLLLWQASATRGWLDARFFPSPTTIAQEAVELLKTGDLQEALWFSTRSLVVGYLCGVTLGLTIGGVTGTSRWFRVALEPVLSALYTVPKLAIFPLLLLIFGLGNTPKIVLISISVYFYVWISTMSGLMSVPNGYREAAASFNAQRMQMFRHVMLPGALPQIFVGLRLGAGVSVLVMVGAEFVSGNEGLGHLIWQSWQLLIARRMYVGIVTVSLLGVVAMSLVKFAGRRLMPWDTSHSDLDIR